VALRPHFARHAKLPQGQTLFWGVMWKKCWNCPRKSKICVRFYRELPLHSEYIWPANSDSLNVRGIKIEKNVQKQSFYRDSDAFSQSSVISIAFLICHFVSAFDELSIEFRKPEWQQHHLTGRESTKFTKFDVLSIIFGTNTSVCIFDCFVEYCRLIHLQHSLTS
jgi:hypothetical protein